MAIVEKSDSARFYSNQQYVRILCAINCSQTDRLTLPHLNFYISNPLTISMQCVSMYSCALVLSDHHTSTTSRAYIILCTNAHISIRIYPLAPQFQVLFCFLNHLIGISNLCIIYLLHAPLYI